MPWCGTCTQPQQQPQQAGVPGCAGSAEGDLYTCVCFHCVAICVATLHGLWKKLEYKESALTGLADYSTGKGMADFLLPRFLSSACNHAFAAFCILPVCVGRCRGKAIKRRKYVSVPFLLQLGWNKDLRSCLTSWRCRTTVAEYLFLRIKGSLPCMWQMPLPLMRCKYPHLSCAARHRSRASPSVWPAPSW